MFFFLAALGLCEDLCSKLYSVNESWCPICVSHYADRQCGWCMTSKKCIEASSASTCPNAFYYGPETDCSASTPPKTPTPFPKPTSVPEPFNPDECKMYKECGECTLHYGDRKCGFCSDSPKSLSGTCMSTINSTCPHDRFYFNNNAKCGAEIPPPTPTPWPRYEANATFCYSMTGKWCQKCVSSNKDMHCIWCHSTKECVMGDADGAYFLGNKCESYSYEEDTKCTGKISDGAILGWRIGISIFIATVSVLCIIGCYKIIKKPKEAQEYDTLN